MSEEATNSCRKKRSERQGERERYTQLKAEFQRIAMRAKKVFFNEQCKEIEENNRAERLEISSNKLEILREHFMQGWTQ